MSINSEDTPTPETIKLRKVFNDIPLDESSIETFHCSIWKSPRYVQGRMYVSQNYIGFNPSIGNGEKFIIPFREIETVLPSNTVGGIFSAGIKFLLVNGTEHFFGSFYYRDSAFSTLYHFWSHPVTYQASQETFVPKIQYGFDGEPIEPLVVNLNDDELNRGAVAQNSNQKPNPFETKSASSQPVSLDFGSGQAVQERVKVDTQTSAQALRIAQEAQEMGMNTLVEMSNQAETIDRIENTLDHVNNSLDKSDRHLRGIESFGGALKNKFSSSKPNYSNPEFIDRNQKKIDTESRKIISKILIFFQTKVKAGIIKFSENDFYFSDSKTNKQMKNFKWKYNDILSVKISRPQVVKINFTIKPLEINFMSSHIQTICNEISLRIDQKNPLNILFLNGVKKFQYGKISLSSRNAVIEKFTEPKEQKQVFRRRNANEPSKDVQLLANLVDEETKTALYQQDKDVNNILLAVDSLKGMGHSLNHEITRQNDQLNRVNGKTDVLNERMYKTNNKISSLT